MTKLESELELVKCQLQRYVKFELNYEISQKLKLILKLKIWAKLGVGKVRVYSSQSWKS